MLVAVQLLFPCTFCWFLWTFTVCYKQRTNARMKERMHWFFHSYSFNWRSCQNATQHQNTT